MFLTNISNRLFGDRQTSRPRRRSTVRLGVERLETRDVPASLSASLSTAGTLTITGSDQADIIQVNQINDRISVLGESISTSSGNNSHVSVSSVKKIIVNANGGDDVIDLNSNSFSTSQLLRMPAFVNGGAGDDIIYGTAANDTINGGFNDDRIWGYGGDDTINNAQVGYDRVSGGRGNDTVNAIIDFDDLLAARSGRLFSDDSFNDGDGTDSVNVRLDLSSFGRQLFTPAIQELRKATGVFDPVVQMLNKPIPALSGFDGNLTYGSVLRQFKPEVGRFLDAVNAIHQLGGATSLSGSIPLVEVKMRSLTDFRTVWADPFGEFDSSSIKAARNVGVSFSFLENPASAIGMMTGQNVPLMSKRLELPLVMADLNRTYSVPTGIPGINATVDFGGQVWASAGATFGLDMRGIWSGNLLKGFHLSNATAFVGGNLYVKGGVAAGIPNLFEVASIKGYGEVHGSINFSLAGGGKVYLDSLPSYAKSLKTTGSIGYDIGIEVGYSELKGTDHVRRIGTKWTGYTNIVWTTYAWESATMRKSFGSGTFEFRV